MNEEEKQKLLQKLRHQIDEGGYISPDLQKDFALLYQHLNASSPSSQRSPMHPFSNGGPHHGAERYPSKPKKKDES
ncbi:MAG: hypothetical protein JW934_15610 [Anaerolineae bacterium]|nr:hypothetical protein [Anaerolineae bacterium]